MAKIPINIKEGTIKKESDIIIGIDLGTTNSLVAYAVEGNIKVVKDDDHHNALVPSVIYFDEDNKTVVGKKAKEKLITDPTRTIFSVKRLMGRSYQDLKKADQSLAYEIIDDDNDKLVRIKIGERNYTPIELSAEILKSLKSRIEFILKENVTKAVITVPAYFNDTQRQATKDAGKLAGLNVLRVVNEPTAASLAYGLNKKSEEAIKIAVYDLGGGTFDISILMIEDGVFEVLSTNGNTYLGGDDFDKAVIDHWTIKYDLEKTLINDSKARNIIRKHAEQAKIHLGSAQEYNCQMALEGMDVDLKLSLEEFNGLIEPIVLETLENCGQALDDAGLSKADLDEIVMVGGSTRTALVKSMVKDFFDRPINDHLNPDEVVAIGAAVQADILAGNRSDMLLLDITPLSLGIETVGGLMDVIIPRNNKIPTRVGRKYTTSVDGQKNLKVAVFQGERDLVEHNRKLGEFTLSGIPAMPAGIPQIEIHFLVDADGILIVRAQELRSGTETKVQIKSQYGISEEEMARMLIDSIKNAELDIKTRSLLEAINEADNISHATKKFVIQNDSWLTKLQVEKIIALEQEMSQAVKAKKIDDIRNAMDILNLYTTPLAHEALDRNIGESLKGTDL